MALWSVRSFEIHSRPRRTQILEPRRTRSIRRSNRKHPPKFPVAYHSDTLLGLSKHSNATAMHQHWYYPMQTSEPRISHARCNRSWIPDSSKRLARFLASHSMEQGLLSSARLVRFDRTRNGTRSQKAIRRCNSKSLRKIRDDALPLQRKLRNGSRFRRTGRSPTQAATHRSTAYLRCIGLAEHPWVQPSNHIDDDGDSACRLASHRVLMD